MDTEQTKIITPELIIQGLKGLACVASFLPALIGVGYGLVQGTHGICKAADYSVDLIHAIIPMAFITAPSIFSLIMFFFLTVAKPTTVGFALNMLMAGIIEGMGNCMAAYCVGCISSSASVTKAQQKKFKGSFFLVMIFGEIIALFSLVAGIIIISAAKNGDSIKQ